MTFLYIKCKSDILVFCLITFASSIRLSLADVSDDSLPGYTKQQKQVFKRLLVNYNPFQSPNPNKIFNVTTRCYTISSYRPESSIFFVDIQLMIKWIDQRLTWTTTENRPRYLFTFKNIKRLWTPKLFTMHTNSYKTTSYVIRNDGTAAIRVKSRLGMFCRVLKQNVYPYNRKQCSFVILHSPDFRIVCGNKFGPGCCFKSIRFEQNIWKIHAMKYKYYNYNRFSTNLMLFRFKFILARQSAENHYYISPPLIVGIMSAFQCLISLSNSRRYLLIFFLIHAAYDCVIASMTIRVIKIGNEQHLINLCAFTLLANILYLVWSCISINVSRAGGVSSSILKFIVEKADRYRFLLLLPSHVEIAESSEKTEIATWNYFSLLLDRLLFVMWIVIFATMANLVI